MTDYTPDTATVRDNYAAWSDAYPEFDRWLAEHDRQVKADALREFADHIDGGTPRAWGFHHPCDPPGVRWEPSEAQAELMRAADVAREAAKRIQAADV